MKKIIFICILLHYSLFVFAQDDTQLFAPTTQVGSRNFEIQLFNNLYTQTQFANQEGMRINQGLRSTFFTTSLNALYGIRNNLSIGVDVLFKSTKLGDESSSVWDVFSFMNDVNARTAVSGLGLRAKYNFSPKFAVQQTIYFPTAMDLDGSQSTRPFLEFQGYQSFTQFFYNKSISSTFSFFGELDLLYRIPSNFRLQNSSLSTPLKLFLSIYPISKTTLYTLAELSPTYGTNIQLIESYYYQQGIGLKYQVSQLFEVETLYTKFLVGKNSGLGNTFNVGLKIRK